MKVRSAGLSGHGIEFATWALPNLRYPDEPTAAWRFTNPTQLLFGAVSLWLVRAFAVWEKYCLQHQSKMTRTALIVGISGQDGAYLAELLLRKGYAVHGTSRDVETQSFSNLKVLNILGQVTLHSLDVTDFRNILEVVSRVAPTEIYNLAGQTSVGLSFAQPTVAFESIAISTIQFLEVMRHLRAGVRLYGACSSECFGQQPHGTRCDENTAFRPRSPYAMAKSASYWAIANYREAFDLFACSGILFNHESPLRPPRFVTKKIVSAAVRIARGSKERLRLGNIDIWRDWGYAPEYVEAMWLMLQQPHADDFVVASGVSHSLRDFLTSTFSTLQLRWEDHVDLSDEFKRPTDLIYSGADATKADNRLGWRSRTSFDQLIRILIRSEEEGLHA